MDRFSGALSWGGDGMGPPACNPGVVAAATAGGWKGVNATQGNGTRHSGGPLGPRTVGSRPPRRLSVTLATFPTLVLKDDWTERPLASGLCLLCANVCEIMQEEYYRHDPKLEANASLHFLKCEQGQGDIPFRSGLNRNKPE